MNFKHTVLASVLSDLYEIKPDLTVAVTGDIHLYHHKVPARRILKHLDDMFPESLLSIVDVIVFNGDVFDRRMSSENESFFDIMAWMNRFMRRCKRHNVRLIIVEGTRSHDHRQSRIFTYLNEMSEIGCDLVYHDQLTVGEIIDGYTAIYVPDEVNPDASVTAEQVRVLLQRSGLDTVDFSFIHGFFPHQLPIESVVAHNPDFYESVTTHRIVVNHVHTPSSVGKIRAPGSPVRLKHGEEETKGFYIAALKDGVCSDWFVEVEGNVVFTTYDVSDHSLSDVFVLLDGLTDIEQGSHIRLRMRRNSVVQPSIRQIKSKYHYFKITEDYKDSVSKGLDVSDTLGVDSVQEIALTTEVLTKLVEDRVSARLAAKGIGQLQPILTELLRSD